MDIEFSDYLLEAVAFAKARQIAAQINRSPAKYTPGRFGVEIEFRPAVDVDEDIDRWVRILEEMGAEVAEHPETGPGRTAWAVFPDGANIEVTTPPLALAQMPLLKQVLARMSGERFTGSTSAHVHVGLPNDTDPFDLLALSTLVDEAQVRMDAGQKRDAEKFAQPNSRLHLRLSQIFEPGTYDAQEVAQSLRQHLGRDFGTNLSAFFEHGTIEFRYLSSQVVKQPEVLCNWIEYYLMMPRVARTRQQIRLKSPQGDVVFSRGQGATVRVDKTSDRVPTSGRPTQDLRIPAETSQERASQRDAVAKLANLTFRDVSARLSPQSQAHLLVVLRNLYPDRNMDRVPVAQVWREIPRSLQRMLLQAG